MLAKYPNTTLMNLSRIPRVNIASKGSCKIIGPRKNKYPTYFKQKVGRAVYLLTGTDPDPRKLNPRAYLLHGDNQTHTVWWTDLKVKDNWSCKKFNGRVGYWNHGCFTPRNLSSLFLQCPHHNQLLQICCKVKFHLDQTGAIISHHLDEITYNSI